jgi:hypothetical protein
MTFPLFYFIFSVSHLSILQDLKYSKAFSIKPKYFHEPISWKKCMMVGRGRLTASPRGKIDSLERKRRRLIVITIEIISFVAHFINNTV